MSGVLKSEAPQSLGFTVIDAFHVLMAGKKARVFPGTGKQVVPSALGSEVTWVGDSIGCGQGSLVTLTDLDGNWSELPADAVQSHEVWARIDEYGRRRLTTGLCYAHELRARREP